MQLAGKEACRQEGRNVPKMCLRTMVISYYGSGEISSVSFAWHGIKSTLAVSGAIMTGGGKTQQPCGFVLLPHESLMLRECHMVDTC